jgi:phage-related protein
VSGAVSWLHSAGNSVATGLVRGWNGAGNAISGAFRRAQSWARSAVSSAGGWLRSAGNSAASGLVHGWNSASGAVSGAFGRASSWVAGAFRGAGGWLFGAGQSIMNSLAAGLNWGIGKVQGILNWVTAHIPSWKGPAAVDAVLLKPAGQLIMGGLQNSLAAGIPGVRGTMQDATAAIAAGLRVPTLTLPALSGSALRGGDGLALTVTYAGPSDGAIAAIVKDLRYDIQGKSGGDVQKHLGRGKVRT